MFLAIEWSRATTFNFTEWKWISIKPQQIIDQFDSDKHRNWQATLMRIIKCIYLKRFNLRINRSRKTLILISKFFKFEKSIVAIIHSDYYCFASFHETFDKKGHLWSVFETIFSNIFFQMGICYEIYLITEFIFNNQISILLSRILIYLFTDYINMINFEKKWLKSNWISSLVFEFQQI